MFFLVRTSICKIWSSIPEIQMHNFEFSLRSNGVLQSDSYFKTTHEANIQNRMSISFFFLPLELCILLVHRLLVQSIVPSLLCQGTQKSDGLERRFIRPQISLRSHFCSTIEQSLLKRLNTYICFILFSSSFILSSFPPFLVLTLRIIPNSSS